MKIKFVTYLLFIILGLGSCTSETPTVPSNRTILVYLLSNNDLGDIGFDRDNINSMISVANAKNLNGGHLVIYYAPKGNNPSLIEIKEGKTQHTIKEYEAQSGVDPNILQQVIKDMATLYPSDSYGMIMWSHATAWLPYNFNNLRSFGNDGGKQMEIDQLAKGIPDHFFEFLMFDACYMGNIECVYQLRNKADYILGSPTETMGSGFPYTDIIPYFFTQEVQLNNVAEAFYNYYNQQSGDYQTATVSVTQTNKLEELAILVKEIMADKTENDLFALPVSNMQALEHLTYSNPMLYDFDDFIFHLATDEQYQRFQSCMNQLIVCKYNTKKAYFGKPKNQYPINKFSGLSVYVPQSAFTQLTDWYKEHVEWYQAVYNKGSKE